MPAPKLISQTLPLSAAACLALTAGAWGQPFADRYQQAPAEQSSVRPVDECQVIARINGELVLSCELLWEANLQIEEMRVPAEHRAEAQRQLMQQLLMQKMDLLMLYSDFRRSAPQADLNSIHESLAEPFEEQEIPRLMEAVGAEDRRQLQARLIELGTSLSERREDFFRVMIARSWAQQGLEFSKEVTHQQLLDYYQKNSEKYDFPTQARWEELMVRFDQAGSQAEAYRQIANLGNQAYQRARQQPDAGQPAFADLAKQSSHGVTAGDGGQHDWTSQGALAAERIDEAIFKLPPGQMSDILRGDSGFHIVRVLERKQAGRTPFTEVQSEIRDNIINQRFSKAISDKMKTLRSESHIWTIFAGDVNRPSVAKGAPQSGSPR